MKKKSTYLWDDGSTAQTKSVNAAGSYHVTVTSPAGCVGSDSIEVDLAPAADFTAVKGTNGSVDLTATATNAVSYFWQFGANNATAVLHHIHMATMVFYNVNMMNGCGDTTKVTRSVTVSTVTVGINEIIKDAKVSIYPDPATDVLRIGNEKDHYLSISRS